MSDSTKEKEKALNSFSDDLYDTEIFETEFSQTMPHQPITAVKIVKKTEEKKEREPTFNPMDLSQLIDIDFPPIDWLVDDFIARGDFILCSGQPKIGKSLVWFQLMLHLSRGINFAQLRIARPQRVYYVDAEMSAQVMQQRLKLYDDQPHIGNKNFLYENCLSSPVRFLLTTEEQQDELVAKCLDEKIDILVLDNLFSLAKIDDWNKPAEYLDKLNPLIKKLREKKITTVLIDHVNKNGEAFGSQAKLVAIDTLMILERDEDEVFTLKIELERALHKCDSPRFFISDENVVSEANADDLVSPKQLVNWLDNNFHLTYPANERTKKAALDVLYKKYEETFDVKNAEKLMSKKSYLANHAVKW